MTWNFIMGVISSVALLLPIVLLITSKLTFYKCFPFLAIYYFLVFIYNVFTEGYIKVDGSITHYWGLGCNLLDTPLMLFFLTYFSTSPLVTKTMKQLIALFAAFEIVIICIYGMTVRSTTIILAPGIILEFGFCLYFFIRQTKIAIMHRKAIGKALIVASLLFAYGCYGIIYMMYYIVKTQHVADTFLVYFMVTIFSSMLMCSGIFIERKRIQKLAELRVTRRELSIVYKEISSAKTIAKPFFERESFN